MKKLIIFAVCFAVLMGTAAPSAVRAGEVKPEDAEFLVGSIAAEYGKLPYAARVGVVAVILNRMKAQAYPDTAAGVISTYRNEDGSLRFRARRLAASERALRMTRDAYAAVASGADVTGGALNFEFVDIDRGKLDLDFDDHGEDEHKREVAERCRKYKLVIDGVGFW